MSEQNELQKGHVVAVSGPVIDVSFPHGTLPHIREELFLTVENERRVMEVAKHLQGDLVRCIMLGASEGISRGMEVTACGHPCTGG